MTLKDFSRCTLDRRRSWKWMETANKMAWIFTAGRENAKRKKHWKLSKQIERLLFNQVNRNWRRETWLKLIVFDDDEGGRWKAEREKEKGKKKKEKIKMFANFWEKSGERRGGGQKIGLTFAFFAFHLHSISSKPRLFFRSTWLRYVERISCENFFWKFQILQCTVVPFFIRTVNK